ncbi:uncharacterized protein LOC119083712 [Bradysia coprophila]|uniref:uncharacterized protein LOC119083712 n=1 Tax=Bradysia coprophila TaxID=38358 RepID=UPI00187DD6B0|nr:uncharacterized protein LOC119083712 [Bradysia coprophila]
MFTESVVFVLAASVVSSTLGITLQNGFDEKLIINLQSKLAASHVCTMGATGQSYQQCSDDCSTVLYCDGNGAATPLTATKCRDYKPYCTKNFVVADCSAFFPANDQQCFNYAMNKFMCSSDGIFPDPADCTKYHVCNGTTHTIQTCPANYRFWFDEQYDANGNLAINENFSCRFKSTADSCYCGNAFSCENNGNKYVSRYGDVHYYAYCLELPTMSKIALFKCPAGTVHNLQGESADQVTCVSST